MGLNRLILLGALFGVSFGFNISQYLKNETLEKSFNSSYKLQKEKKNYYAKLLEKYQKQKEILKRKNQQLWILEKRRPTASYAYQTYLSKLIRQASRNHGGLKTLYKK